MNPCALGWNNHRKFSKVSVTEQTADGEIRAVERARLVENLEEDALVLLLLRLLLMTIPGIGLILAHVIRAEIGEIERFPRSDTWPASLRA